MEQENPEGENGCRPKKSFLFNPKANGMFDFCFYCSWWLFICWHKYSYSQHQHG